MLRLKVREVAEAQNLNLSQLQRRSGVTMPSVRRYWYNTRDGKSEGEPLLEVNLTVLEAIADALKVDVTQLIEKSEEELPGNSRPMQLAA